MIADTDTEVLQKYYDETITYLRGQKESSRNDDGRCCYRTKDGNACAIGYHIPEDMYSPVMEGNGVRIISTAFPELDGVAWPSVEGGVSLAVDLQHLHDYSSYRIDYPPIGLNSGSLSKEGEAKAQSIAFVYGLKYTPVGEQS